ncbi:MAG: sensor histidine kinase [Paracoccaceae bacterium]
MRTLLSLRRSPHYMKVLAIFVVTSFLAIFTTTVVLSQYLANYMATNMMMRDAVVSMEFLNSIVRVEEQDPRSFPMTPASELTGDPETDEFFVHVSRLPDVFRANVYAANGEILWSSDRELIGQTFAGNEELETALRGELHPEIVVVERGEKEEHVGLPEDAKEFIEFYIPIWAESGDTVIGAVEVYKAPESLVTTIHHVVALAWVGAIISGTVLFSALLFVVYYAASILKLQEQRLVETERLAVVGEMASAVAHGLRNPLAAIRSCAELAADDDIPAETRNTVLEITDQVDRLESWIRSFLTRTRDAPELAADTAHVDMIIKNCIQGFSAQLEKRDIRTEVQQSSSSPVAAASSSEVEQVLNTVLSNAIEAMNVGGLLTIRWSPAPGGRIVIEVEDTGPGLSSDQIERLFVPFQTSKSSGLGVGLALGRSIAERLGGTLDLKNRAECGVAVTLTLPAKA